MNVAEEFDRRFGGAPASVWAAPGRVNLIGEHTDYNGGPVLPFAVRLETLTAARLRDDGQLRLHSAQRGSVELRLEDVGPGRVSGWSRYVAGSIAELRELGADIEGVDLHLDSSVPVGAGLSSSAAIICSVVGAVTELCKHPLAPLAVAQLAQRVELNYASVPCGLMDPLASWCGARGRAILLDCHARSWKRIALSPADSGAALWVIDTGTRRELSDGRYAQRRQEREAAAELLGASRLSLVTSAQLSQAKPLPPPLARRARHVVTEIERVTQAARALESGELRAPGPLLTASHASLRKDFAVSAPALDTAVSAAVEAGAWGARLLGGGFAGSVLALGPDTQDETGDSPIVAAVAAALTRQGFGPVRGFRVAPQAGARPVF